MKDDCNFLNLIYLPSKYPVGSALPDYEPDEKVCQEAINIAEKVLEFVDQFLGQSCYSGKGGAFPRAYHSIVICQKHD
jgi:HEPN domain-containing protein